jgi:hypothetical protein
MSWDDDELHQQAFPTLFASVVFIIKCWWVPNSPLSAIRHPKVENISKNECEDQLQNRDHELSIGVVLGTWDELSVARCTDY